MNEKDNYNVISKFKYISHTLFTYSFVKIFRSAYVIQQQEQLASKKHDLSKWKYSDLRDAINTSCGNIPSFSFIMLMCYIKS